MVTLGEECDRQLKRLQIKIVSSGLMLGNIIVINQLWPAQDRKFLYSGCC
jgi:hypothetical protein